MNSKKYLSFLTENNKYFLLEKEESKKEELFLSKQLDYSLLPPILYLISIKPEFMRKVNNYKHRQILMILSLT